MSSYYLIRQYLQLVPESESVPLTLSVVFQRSKQEAEHGYLKWKSQHNDWEEMAPYPDEMIRNIPGGRAEVVSIVPYEKISEFLFRFLEGQKALMSSLKE